MTPDELIEEKEKINKQVVDDRNISLLHIREDGSLARVYSDFKISCDTVHDIELRDYRDVDETIEALYRFKRECKELEKEFPNSIIQQYEEADNDYGDSDPYVSGFGFRMFNCEITDEEVKRVQNKRFREFLQKKLGVNQTPTCELTDLFMSGKIDWDTLRVMADKNCEW